MLHSAGAEPAAVITTPQVRAELVAHAPAGVQHGGMVALGLKTEHQPHWHTYGKNRGDPGEATTLVFSLPEGFVASEVEWTLPSPLPTGPLMNSGYAGTLLLPATVRVPAALGGETLDARLRAAWLACSDTCISESGDSVLALQARGATDTHAARFDEARQARKPVATPQTRAYGCSVKYASGA